MTLDLQSLALLVDAARRLEGEYGKRLPPFEAAPLPDEAREILVGLADRLGREDYPFAHPLYAGQMLKPPHPLARLAYTLATFVNPNAHALDGGRVSSALEKEAVASIAAMFGFARHLGHLSGGGTMANLEALWIHSRVNREAGRSTRVFASAQAHFTHERLSDVLGLPFTAVACDERGRMRADVLEDHLRDGEGGCVVATLGTTGRGAIDPLADLLPVARRHGARVHIDAAYGGYFTLVRSVAGRAHFEAIASVDSVVVDPHKHGLQPYGCGCVVFADPAVGVHYRHDSPYTYFSSDELHLGEISLECSRPGAAAIALWATMQLLPLEGGGAFAADLEACLAAAHRLHGYLRESGRWLTLSAPELDIVVFAPLGANPAEVSERSRALFRAAAKRELHLAMIELPAPALGLGEGRVTCLRSVLMKPEHDAWLEQLVEALEAARDDVESA
ncbi:MAG: pyridoxal-dependent decarboxylase [Myxococcota bacterium]